MVDFNIRVKVDSTGAVAGTARVDRQLTQLNQRAAGLRSTFLRAFGVLASGAAIVGAIRTLADFEQEMSTVRAITQATETQFASLQDRAKELGATTRFSATQAAEGMTFLARAGFEVNEVLDSIGPTLQLAQAGALQLGQAADIASNVLQGFRLPATEASRAVDVLAFTANNANTTVGQLGDGLKLVAPIAAGLGVDLEETAAAMGALGDAGLQATLGGTGLRAVLAVLESPTKMAAELFERLGVSLDEIRPSSVGLTEALQRLADAGIDTGTALEIFGRRGGPAFEVLVSSIPKVRELTEELKNAEGTAARIAETMDQNLKGALLAVRSAFEAVILAFGQAGPGGILEQALRALADGLRFLAANIDILVNLAEALAVVLGIKLVRSVIALGVAIAANPIGAIITAVTVATGLLVGFADEIDAAGDGITTLADVGIVAFEAIRDVVTPIIEGIGVLLAEVFGDGVQITFRGFVEGVASTFDQVLGIVRGSIFVVRDLFANDFDQALNLALLVLTRFGLEARRFFENLGNGIVDLFRDPIGTIARAIQTLINSVAGAASVAASLGIISEESRLNVEDAVASIEASVARLEARRPPPIFDTEETKARIDELDSELSQTFENIGQNLAGAFEEGFNRDTVFGFVQSIFDEAEQRAMEREARIAAERAAAAAAPAGGEGEGPGRSFDELNRKIAETNAGLDETNNKLSDAARRAKEVEQSFTLEAGFERGLERVATQIADVGSLLENTLVNAFGAAEDALVDFVRTGEFNFEQFVDQLLDDLARLLVRLLILQALNAILPGAGTVGSIAAGAVAGSRQSGGPVQAGLPFLVGERGPEIFTPRESGMILPNGQTQAMLGGGGGETVVQSPPVNVQVVTVTDPDEIGNAIDSGDFDQRIINVLHRNRNQAKGVLA